MIRRRLIIGLLTLHFCGLSNAVEILRWDRIPLALPLIIGQERIVFVDQNVRVGLPRNLVDKLRVQSTGGALYLLAKEPIEPTRLQLQNMNSGEIMLVDIIATVGKPNQAAPEPVKIVAGENPATRYGQVSSKPTGSRAAAPTVQTSVQSADEDPPKPRRETPLPVVMTRYAAQMLYAPLRTVEPVDGIAQVNLKRGLDLTTLLPTLPVGSSALGSWRLDEYWVTAVKLRNTSSQHLTLDPRDLMGDFVTATFQHPYLGAKGDASDTTTVYLVTRGHGLAESLLPVAVSQIDPKGGRREE
ncbi:MULTISPECIES: TIGR03749 family integrating conjugative element protein [Pseudomonadaceae]|uniref:TIGR03749 family integrating conjugative element protein n=2 Tax=Pseudomonas TaxID=286 RepID=A0A7Y1MPH2_9PSED|nr:MULTISPECIES: TIGR03749 family integrating conjugative element protein [Pseudomonadaceae]MCF5562196.1 TIGR03749 family integrating conjugative element protein [Pseudomonas sp. PA-3-5D]MCF5569537.1 TIGR03749 family integrating conjugative element protein [Pseudomonas sp. PA-3-11C]MCF5592921.1 TIGR03749 family integrating conjugative element protein [Pseudomonas sp. PA-3-10C]MCQ4322938.1 TIGR03749 family integrating conjugative element protein [Stutzerimonas stutzeri]NNA95891.1 TIGR03749 fami